MTFAEWQAKYSGIRVTYPYAEAPTVAMITDRLIPGGPLQDLRELSDYMITGDMLEAHYGPTVWLAPREDHDWTRTDYMNHRCSHEQYYRHVAEIIGFRALVGIVLSAMTKDQIAAALTTERHLSAIPLAGWDALHASIRGLIAERNKSNDIMARTWCGQPLPPGTFCWSLSESVCVAKAVARAIVEENV